MIIDAFPFFNELDTLEIRLKELWNIVDKFVLVECAKTFAGIKKPFYFDENKERFSAFLSKIHHFKVMNLPPLISDTEKNRQWLEIYHKNQIMPALLELELSNDDLVIISDVDEIPKNSVVQEVSKSCIEDEIYLFQQDIRKFFIEGNTSDKKYKWLGSIAIRYNIFGKYFPVELRNNIAGAGRKYCNLDKSNELINSQKIVNPGRRYDISPFYKNQKVILLENAGWHLTYFGGKKCVEYKVANFTHGASKNSSNSNDAKPLAITRENQISSLKPYNDQLHKQLLDIITNELNSNIPSPVLKDLPSYYHLFRFSHSGLITKEEVIWCYRTILGREPESEEVIDQNMQVENFEQLRTAFLKSLEFKSLLKKLEEKNEANKIKITNEINVMITREEVIWCYRTIFGRVPESEKVISEKMKLENFEQLRTAFLKSLEFKSLLKKLEEK
ncbi:MAG: hypothetical protein DVB29_06115 [Verrucomicrobia bacterium]|nr:MAG: hypothetical protein DVB29_06115 [Verrucomicrobiota bacterium]